VELAVPEHRLSLPTLFCKPDSPVQFSAALIERNHAGRDAVEIELLKPYSRISLVASVPYPLLQQSFRQ